jgi:glycolate oxidase FAD binding subunit
VADLAIGAKVANSALWRISVAPSSAARLVEAIAAKLSCRFAYDWSGGLVWIWIADETPDLGAAVIRSAIAATGGGHATLIRGPADKRAAIDVFQPQAPALAALNARLKQQFDPAGILNQGRMVREE